jgi:hypothetical protein
MNSNKIIVIALLGLLALNQVYAHKCGTPEPPRGTGTSKTEQEACFSSNPCDTAAVRDSYIKTSTSAMLTMRVNSIYFGALNDTTAKTNYDKNNEFFVAKYKELLGINVVIESREVNDEYQSVGADDKATHLAMAQKYYRAGWMTTMYTIFDPNTEGLLGYASGFPNALPADLKDWYTIMGIHGLGPAGTTIHHEVGHMIGLYHTFIQQCDACAEGVNSADRNVLGDLCNDTLAVQNESVCNGTLAKPNDCTDVPFGDYAALPLDNYMAYTEDSCQTAGFTPQQSGRARCYLSTSVSFLNPDAAPVVAPTNTPTAAPGTRVSSATQAAAALVSLTALALAF